MITLKAFRVPAEGVPLLRDWMAEQRVRVEEVRVTMRGEGVDEECVSLVPLEGSDDAIIVYAVASDDYARAWEVFQSSTIPIDLEHQARMAAVGSVPLPVDELFRAVATDGVPSPVAG